MGYWEQTGVENRRHRERMAAMPPRERAFREWIGEFLATGFSLLFWALMLVPIGALAWRFLQG